jgi:hypothetical protein
MRLFDPTFKYVPSTCTDVAATWRRFGFRPTTESDRRARRLREPPFEASGSVDPAARWLHPFVPPANPRSSSQ